MVARRNQSVCDTREVEVGLESISFSVALMRLQ